MDHLIVLVISATEMGQWSNSKARPPPFVCEICAESKDADELFQVQGCVQSYCRECMGRYIPIVGLQG